jgi:DNA primase
MAARGRPKRERPEQDEARLCLARSLHETVKTETGYPPRSGEEWTALLRAAARGIEAMQAARPALPAEESPPGLWDALTWLARREGFAVARGNTSGTGSLTRWDRQYISVSTDLGQPQAEQALAHELGHLLMHQAPWLPADISTAGCRGTRKLEADSVASIVTTWLGLEPPVSSWPSTASWAGSDPRARPEVAIDVAVGRILQAAVTITAHLSTTLFSTPIQAADTPQPELDPVSRPPAEVYQALADAERFYLASLKRGWAPGYLASRGLSTGTIARWRIGYAPARWTALASHLRSAGHDDDTIEAAGLARRSSRGTLIDYFRDRVMLAIRDEHGQVAGFIGRAHPSAAGKVPKYLNSPDTAAFTKGSLLFGLHEVRDQLAAGALPVIVEGPFDVIAVTAAGPQRYAGIAPCGTALSSRQAGALARVLNVTDPLIILALDGDRAGRTAALRAWDILRTVTTRVAAAVLPAGRDPAEILHGDGAAALTGILRQARPLAELVIDAHLDQWTDRLRFAEGQVAALRSAALLIARTLPVGTTENILRMNALRQLNAAGDQAGLVACPQLPVIARLLPEAAASQVARAADRLGVDFSEVITEVANAVADEATDPKGPAVPVPHDQSRLGLTGDRPASPVSLTAGSFPDPPHSASRTKHLRPARAGAIQARAKPKVV